MELNKYIDHTNLKAYATKDDIIKLCDEAKKYKFASVCVNPYYVGFVRELLEDSNVAVCTVIGFPLGQNTTAVKEFEAINAVQEGADEIDMVANIAAIKDGNYAYVKEEIETIRDSIEGKVLKVIIETCYLTKEEIIKMTEICNETFVNFIKTSTGFGTSGAKLEDVELINEHKMDFLEIKASGGIRTYEDICKFIDAGARRIGTSNGNKIMNDIDNKKGDNCKLHNCEHK